jgi:hypothetical protein
MIEAAAEEARKLAGSAAGLEAEAFFEGLAGTGLAFSSSAKGLQAKFHKALGLLSTCVLPSPSGKPMLIEGGVYRGCWLESTATIGAQTLSRFSPAIASSTFETLASLAREDGLLPYKVLPSGAAYRQVQMVTPLARSVYEHALLSGEGEAFLGRMYLAMSANDAWLAKHRDTRGSGGVEAFCAFDTGHDKSPRFWHISDTTYLEDPGRYDPESPLLPFIAPDMTANVYCQRLYLARIARLLSLSSEAEAWEEKAQRSLAALMDNCWDEEDEFFYDLDKGGRFVRVQSDVLLRVYACEAGSDELFKRALERYLLNTRKFYASCPFTSIAMDDPRFDPRNDHNSWAGPTNVLSDIRAPAAFEAHGRIVELSWALNAMLSAYAKMERFGQCLSPWTGEEGYTECYSPALLGFLDALERLVGILPRSSGELWFSAGSLPALSGGEGGERATSAYSRRVGGRLFELAVGPEGARATMDGKEIFSCPRGLRVATDLEGRVLRLIGMVDARVEGKLAVGGRELAVSIGGNEVLRLEGGVLRSEGSPGVVAPSY